jgi:hypothetical protein
LPDTSLRLISFINWGQSFETVEHPDWFDDFPILDPLRQQHRKAASTSPNSALDKIAR